MKRAMLLLLAVLLLPSAACTKQEEAAVPTHADKKETTETATAEQPVEADGTKEAEPQFNYRSYDWFSLVESELFDGSDLSLESRNTVCATPSTLMTMRSILKRAAR